MCYSAQASFLTAATLTPIGIFCMNSAIRRHPRLWPVASVPLGFAIQQAMEGVIWISLDHNDQATAEMAARIYLFFAICWWPFWGPLTALVAATEPRKKRLLSAILILSSGWFFYYYLPMLADFRNQIQATVVHHSIRYSYSDTVILGGSNRVPMTILYLLFTAGPFFIQRVGNRSWVPIFIGFSSVFAAHYFATYAYTSVWCIFAALLSSYSLVYFRRLDKELQPEYLNGALPTVV
ncbi:MAG: DUF6629 family protein [Isosphaeraceae bacterium]